ncbi:acyl-CoA synthetase FdrA [Acetonema longum]|uniref:FdrA family protein n=1 Tax=Acetonema longum DSM 6540 TaxID=1009370 RepID=F7NKK3_9FIRM|nr:acyl-CoA synthetase FdrA [Acetonema longum]EGO63455.1 FdrA family protein [Acetonema longum DSM 6540]
MEVQVLIKANAYYDSVTLMAISKKMKNLPGVLEAVVSMGTELNKELIAQVGMGLPSVTAAGPNDLIIAVGAADAGSLEYVLKEVEQALVQRNRAAKGVVEAPKSLEGAVAAYPESNLAIISLPGAFAAREVRKALENQLHVMLFSDNVSLQDEVQLKKLAHDRGLLLMGPDCGTAIINHVPLCFANVVRPGNIGVVAASGTGTQEVTCLIDRFGGGVSQVIGTGGRDLKAEVGGIMMLDALQALENDPATDVIVIISKPPAPGVTEKILGLMKRGGKPKVVYFLGGDRQIVEQAGAVAGCNLADTARKAVALANKEPLSTDWSCVTAELSLIRQEQAGLAPGQKYVRALYTGGTLCDEAILAMQEDLGPIYSNIVFDSRFMLPDSAKSMKHTAIDLGDDKFTVGRPHPMIDPTIRLERLLQEARDPETAVILLDVVLGYGSHPDPAGILAPVVKEAKKLAKGQGRYLSVVASICGTYRDPQDYADQQAKLVDAGVALADANIKAARLAAAIVKNGA